MRIVSGVKTQMHKKMAKIYIDGLNLRRIGVWDTVELDVLYMFVGQKNGIYLVRLFN